MVASTAAAVYEDATAAVDAADVGTTATAAAVVFVVTGTDNTAVNKATVAGDIEADAAAVIDVVIVTAAVTTAVDTAVLAATAVADATRTIIADVEAVVVAATEVYSYTDSAGTDRTGVDYVALCKGVHVFIARYKYFVVRAAHSCFNI